MKSKVFILMISCLLPVSTIAASDIKNMTITEIKSVMPENPDEGNAKNHSTQVMVTDWRVLPENVTFSLLFISENETIQHHYQTTVTIDKSMPEDQLPIIFDGPVRNADRILLEAGTPELWFIPLAIAEESLTLRDLEARVGILANDHVRMTTGVFDEVTNGVVTCKAENSPCFFSKKEVGELPLVVERCQDLLTQAEHTVRYCDETVSNFIDISEEPTLILLDELHMNVRHHGIDITNTTKIEVVALDSEEVSIDQTQRVDCSPGVDDNGCSLVLSEDVIKEMKSIMVNYVDEDGYVEASALYPFENFQTNTLNLMANALGTNWKTEKENTFEVLVKSSADIDGYLFKSEVMCEGDANPCESFFLDLTDKSQEYYISVGLTNTNSLVAKSVPTNLIPEIDIHKMTRTNDSLGEQLTTNFLAKADVIPTSARLIEISVKESEKTVNQIFHNGDLDEIPDGYIFACEDEVPSLVEEKKFILVEYDETKSIKRAGVIYLRNEVTAQFDWLADSRVLKGIVTVPESIDIGDQSCTSTCYLTGLESQTGFLPVCNTIKDSASEEHDVEYCEDWTPSSHPELQVMKIQLNEGEAKDPTSKISVTAPYSAESTNIALLLFSNSTGQEVEELVCNFIDNEGDTTCSAEGIHMSSSSAALQVLVIGETSDGEVKESTIVDVEHLEFSTEKLFSDTLLVHWTATHANDYVANLTTSSSIDFKANHRDGNGESITSSDVTCSEDSEVAGSGSCNAYFYNLPADKDYFVIVHKKGEEMSETAQHIGQLDSLGKPEGDEINIVKVSKITETKTKLVMSEEITGAKMDISLLVNDIEGASQVSGENIEVDDTKKVLSFTHDLTWFDDPTEAIFTVISHKDDKLSSRGKIDFNVQVITSSIAWVGGKVGTSNATLRVDVGNQQSVPVGSKECSKENSPCYYIEDSSIETQGLERCVTIDEDTEQCDEEITSFKQLPDVKLSLEGSDLKITAPLDTTGAVLEVRIYDPKNTTAEVSIGNTTCNPEEANEDSILCMQRLKIPNDRRPVKVLVTEIDTDGAVLKSALVDLKFPSVSEGVQSWVIAVSVLGSVFVAATIVYLSVVAVKRKRSRKWQSKTVEKELDAISEATSRHSAINNQTPPHGRRYPDYPEPNPSANDDYYHQGPSNPPQNSSGGSQYYQSPVDYIPQRSPPAQPQPRSNDPYQSGYANSGFNSEEIPPPVIPKVLPRINLGPSKKPAEQLTRF